MKKTILIFIAAALVVGAAAFYFSSDTSAGFLWSLTAGGERLLPLVAVAALVDSINPCAFSILLLTIAFLVSIGKLRSKILGLGLSYILGIFLVYMLIGLGILGTLHIFNTPHFMAKVGATLLIVLGLINLVNEFFPAFPIKIRIPHAAHRGMAKLMDKASLPAVFALGGLVGLCEFPCTGGPYFTVVGLLHDQVTYFKGFGYLLIYNLIFVLPLLIILGLASNAAVLEKVQTWQREKRLAMRIGGGVAMIALGIVIFLI